MARLGDVCDVRDGTHDSPVYIDRGFPLVTSKNIINGKLDLSVVNYISPEDYNKINERSNVECGDIIMPMIGTIGNPYIVGDFTDFAIKNVALIKFNNEQINNKYIYHFLNSEKFNKYVAENNRGGTQKFLSLKDIRNLEVEVPSLKEQLIIIEKLDELNELILSRKQQLSKLDELVKARFVEMFGDKGKQVPLIDYVWFQEGPGVRSVDFTEDGTILLTGSNINDNTISFGHKSDRHISNELSSGKYAHFMCDKDDILVVSSAIDPDKFDKKVVVVDTDKKYCLNTGIIRFKPNKQYLTLGYFREFLKTDYFKRQVSSEMRGIAQMHFGPSHLKQMTILLPDTIEQQIEFESFVQKTDKSKFEIQQSLEKLETLKKSLMQQYFG